MKIAVYHNLPSGGGKRALYEMARRLAPNHEMDVFTLASANHDYCDLRPFSRQHAITPFAPLPLAGSPFGRINQMIRLIDIQRRDAANKQVAALIDAGNYDVAFVHNCQYGQSPAVLKYLRTPSVYFCGEPPRYLYEPRPDRPYSNSSPRQQMLDRVDPLPGLFQRTLKRVDIEYTRAASLVLANSAYSRETMYRTYGIFSRVAYLGVDSQLFRPLPADAMPPLPEEDYVISVGSLIPNKGYAFLIESLGLLPQEIRPKLVIVSNYTDPQERAFLDGLAGRCGVKVEYRSMVTDEELVRLYNQARLTVYAPVMEPFGFVPLESMACGTPVVGVREAGVRESVLHEITGLQAERDPRQFAQAVERLLRDPARRAQYGEKGAAHVRECWQWEACIRFIEGQLAEVAQAGRAK